MVICSFLGHIAVYETSTYEKIRQSILNIVQENDEVDFRFFRHGWDSNTKKPFLETCFDIACEMKAKHPEKVFITWVVADFFEKYAKNAFEERKRRFPVLMIDSVITPQFSNPGRTTHKQLYYDPMEWLLKQSDYIISYVYPKLVDRRLNSLLDTAKKSGAILYDITDESSSACILIKESSGEKVS